MHLLLGRAGGIARKLQRAAEIAREDIPVVIVKVLPQFEAFRA